jgi:uncharacterized protein YqhQ
MAVADSFMTETIQIDDTALRRNTATVSESASASKEKDADNSTSEENKASTKIETNIVKIIMAFCCCCSLPFAILALVYTLKAKSKMKENNCDAAQEASEKANIWSNLAIAIGILWIIYYIFFAFSAVNERFIGGFYEY